MKRTKFSDILSLVLAMAVFCTAVAPGMLVASASGESLVISDCDTLSGWTKTGGSALSVNPNGCGTNTAIHSNVDKGAFRTATYTLPEQLDISSYKYIEWDAMFYTTKNNGMGGTMWEQVAEQYGTGGSNSILLKIGSSANDYRVYFFSRMETTVNPENPYWVHFKVTVDSFNTSKGNFDPTGLKTFYFSTVDGAVNAGVDDGFIRLDNIKATGYTAPPKTPVIISECESTEHWRYGGSADITTSAAGKTGSALHLYSGCGAMSRLTYTPPEPLDLTGYTAVEWDMTALADKLNTDKFAEIAEKYTETIGFEISDGTNTVTYPLTDWQISQTGALWRHFAVALDPAALNLAGITSFTIYTRADGAPDTSLPDVIYKLDNITATDAAVTPNGYDYAALLDKLLNGCESTAGWTYRGDAQNVNMSINENGFTGNALQVFAGHGQVGNLRYDFSAPVNISRYGYISWNIRFLQAGTANDMWEKIKTAYRDYIAVTLTDDAGNTFVYSLADIMTDSAENGWYTMTVSTDRASGLDVTRITAFTFRIADNYSDDSLESMNLRIDNLSLLAPKTLARGDANGDGAVDIRDLIRVKRAISGIDVRVYMAAADLNSDGDLNADDVVFLRRILLGTEAVSDYFPLSNTGWSITVKP